LNLGGNFVSAGVLGSFSQLGSMSYDWYRADSSTTDAHLHPVLRVLLDADGDLTTTGDRGGLVFERVYIEASGWTAGSSSFRVEPNSHNDSWSSSPVGMCAGRWPACAHVHEACLIRRMSPWALP
jgi:hypothetical protein